MVNLIWYMKYQLWNTLDRDRRGDYRGFVQMLRQMALGVRYLNFMGFGHADLSGRNVLCNPVAGKAVVIDMDGLVVTNYMMGDIGGTPGFMAPELVDGYVGGNPTVPTNITDRHALAVIIFHVLLWRHPLIGKRPPLTDDLTKDQLLQQSSKYALYVHHPTDHSNSVAEKNYLPLDMLPGEMQDLFAKTFIDGLRHPTKRPHPDEWVSALRNLEDDLIPCTKSTCEMKFFPSLDGTVKTCPFCGAPAKIVQKVFGTITVLHATENGIYPYKGRQVNIIKLKKRSHTLKRIDLFGKHVPNPDKPTLLLTSNNNGWHVTLQDRDLQVMLMSDDNTQFILNILSINHETTWSKHQVAVVTLLDITCMIKLE
jgi:serine/threonine protein kinase